MSDDKAWEEMAKAIISSSQMPVSEKEAMSEAVAPKTADNLKTEIEGIAEACAKSGHGSYYELYAQEFTRRVDHWLDSLPDGSRDEAQKYALAHEDYMGEVGGRWSYNEDANDISYTGSSSPADTSEQSDIER